MSMLANYVEVKERERPEAKNYREPSYVVDKKTAAGSLLINVRINGMLWRRQYS